jgi:disulfide oxidoreductase YuzD
MMTDYDIYLNGYGHYKVCASIYKIPESDGDYYWVD